MSRHNGQDVLQEKLFTREEVLRGLPGRRAQTLFGQMSSITLSAIESRSRAAAWFGPRAEPREGGDQASSAAEAIDERDQDEAWLTSFRQRARRRRQPTIMELELYASAWAPHMPSDPRVRAALAHLLARHYRFRARNVPHLRAALGLDSAEVREAYQTLYDSSLDSVYSADEKLSRRARWLFVDLGKRINTLPPFWIAFAYGLMGNFTEGVVVLPIVAAVVEPLFGLMLLALYGTVNALTMGLMAEAIVRSGAIEYRNAFLRRITAGYLGRTGATLASYNSFVHWFLVVLAGYVGFSLTLSHAVGLHPSFWILLWALFLVYRLWRIEHSSSLPGDLLIGGACVTLVLGLSVASLWYATSGGGGEAVAHAPGEALLTPLSAVVVIGVLSGMQAMYFGHTLIPQSAKLVLPRDPGGRSFIRGSVAGTLCAVVIQGFWLLAVRLAIPAEALLDHAHTAVEPLGEALGPAFVVIGVITVCAFIALDGTGASDILFGLVRERIPVFSHAMVTLKRDRGRLLLAERDPLGEAPRLGFTYQGLKGNHPHFQLAVYSGYRVTHHDVALEEHWSLHELYAEVPELRRRRYELTLDLIDATEENVRLLVATPLRIESETDVAGEGLHVIETLDLRSDELRLLRWLMTHGQSTVREMSEAGFGDERAVHAMLQNLERRQMVQHVGQGAQRDSLALYRPRWTRRGHRRLPDKIWKQLGVDEPETAPTTRTVAPPQPKENFLRAQLRRLSLSETGTFLLGIGPTLVAAIVANVLVFTDRASFVQILVLGGVLVLLLAAGIFPVLFYLSSRRKGLAIPSRRWSLLGHPLVLVLIYAAFLLLLILHGAVYWQAIIVRVAVFLVAGGVLVATVSMVAKGAFAPRLSIEVREDLRHDRKSAYRATLNGRPARMQVHLRYRQVKQEVETVVNELPDFRDLQAVEFEVPASTAQDAQELMLWMHRVTPEGDSEPLPASVKVTSGEETRVYDLELVGGQITMPLAQEAYHIRLQLQASDEA